MQFKKLTYGLLFLAFVWFIPADSTAQQLDPVLQELIQKGLNKSHTINIFNLEAKQAKIDQNLSKTVFLPKITLNGSFTRLDDDITFDNNTQSLLTATQKLLIKEAAGIPFNAPFPAGIPLEPIPNLQDKNILKSSVDVDWVLFSGLQANNALKASKHKEASLNHLSKAEEEKIALQIIETYNKLALVNASKRVLSTTEDYLTEQEQYVVKAIKNGLATPIARKKIELAQHQLAGKLLEFEQNRILLIEVLHQLTYEDRENLSLLNPKLMPFSVEPTTNIEKRSELKALEEAEEATNYQSKMESSNIIPKIALKGHYEFIEDDLSLLEPKWYVGVGIKWNVFDGFQTKLKSERAKIESLKYRSQKDDAEEMMSLAIVKAELDYESAIENTKIVKKEIELASDTYEMVNKQYKNNLASINEVLDALTDLEKANFKLQESYLNQHKAGTELLHAKGILNYQF